MASGLYERLGKAFIFTQSRFTFSSIYLSFYHVAFRKVTQKSLRIALMSSSELLVVFRFAEKAFNPKSKRLSNQALLRLRRVSNSFCKFFKRCLPMNFSLRRSKYTQINDGHGNCLSQFASYSCQFNTGRVSRRSKGCRQQPNRLQV